MRPPVQGHAAGWQVPGQEVSVFPTLSIFREHNKHLAERSIELILLGNPSARLTPSLGVSAAWSFAGQMTSDDSDALLTGGLSRSVGRQPPLGLGWVSCAGGSSRGYSMMPLAPAPARAATFLSRSLKFQRRPHPSGMSVESFQDLPVAPEQFPL